MSSRQRQRLLNLMESSRRNEFGVRHLEPRTRVAEFRVPGACPRGFARSLSYSTVSVVNRSATETQRRQKGACPRIIQESLVRKLSLDDATRRMFLCFYAHDSRAATRTYEAGQGSRGGTRRVAQNSSDASGRSGTWQIEKSEGSRRPCPSALVRQYPKEIDRGYRRRYRASAG